MGTKATTDNLPAIVEHYAVLQFSPDELKEAVEENLQGERLGVSDLDRVKIPAGGGTIWEVPTMDGTDDVKELDGVIIFWKVAAACWKDEYSGGSAPPDCYSDDGKTGHGLFAEACGGECAKCPMHEWGSSPKGGNAKGCKEVRQVFILQQDSLLPILLNLPPSSIKPFRKYLRQLLQRGKSYTSVVSRFTVEKDTNAGCIVYSRVKATALVELPAEAKAKIKAFAESIRPTLEAVRAVNEDFVAAEGDEESEGE